MPSDPQTAFNDWALELGSTLPGWLLGLLGLALLLALWRCALGLRSERRAWHRRLLLGLRLGSSVIALLLLLEPTYSLLQVRRVKNRLVLLLDRSRSMQLKADSEGHSRFEKLQSLFAHSAPQLKALADRFVVEAYTFDERAVPLRLEALGTQEAKGRKTRLLASLNAALGEGQKNRKLAGVLIFSDGADTDYAPAAANAEAASAEATLPAALAEHLATLEAPIHSFVIGGGIKQTDLAVTRVSTDDFAFVRNAISVEASIRAHGVAPQKLPVVLRRDGRIVASTTAEVGGDTVSKVSFHFTPDTTGKFVYSVSIPVVAGELLTTNNQRSFLLKVIRDRVRVLQVAGQPSWDERYLRGLLKRDPNVDLISFFILRTPRDDAAVANNELSLIPFPTDELFTKQLKTFDLVVFQNFDYFPYEVARYLKNVADYVRDGGAFAMIGGDQSFGAGGYQGTYIEDILPVLVPGRGERASNGAPFAPVLTVEGRRHPITALTPRPDRTEQLLAQLPPLEGINLVRSVRPEAQVLLAHPSLRLGGQPAPLLAVLQVGRGRSLALMSDSSWFWRLPAAGAGANRRIYDQFWTNALRWLVRDPELTALRLRSDKDSYEPGEPVKLELSVRSQNYDAARGAAVVLKLTSAESGTTAELKGQTGDDGVAHLEFTPSSPGAYKVVASASAGGDGAAAGESLGEEVSVFAVRQTGVELMDPAPRLELLGALSKVTDGELFKRLPDTLPELDLEDPKVVEVGRKQSSPLWDRWGFLLLLFTTLGAEWLLRRRFGHP